MFQPSHAKCKCSKTFIQLRSSLSIRCDRPDQTLPTNKGANFEDQRAAVIPAGTWRLSCQTAWLGRQPGGHRSYAAQSNYCADANDVQKMETFYVLLYV